MYMYQKLSNVKPQLYYCNIKQDQVLNERIAERNYPSTVLQPQFSQRPISTKYSLMPILDRRAPTKVPIEPNAVYDIKEVLNPGDREAPWSGFAANIDVNSSLRNQFFALQKCEQSSYIPNSTTCLYEVEVTGRQEKQPFPGLFKQENFDTFNPNTCNLGNATFNNSTRTQLKQFCAKENVYENKICN